MAKEEMKHFSREIILKTHKGEITDPIPYNGQYHTDYIQRWKKESGIDPLERFCFGPIFKGVSARVDDNLWDGPTQTYIQEPENFNRLRHRFSEYLPKELPPGSRITEYGVISYPYSKTTGHLRRLINPLADIKKVSEIEGYPFPDFSEEWRWEGIHHEVERYKNDNYAVIGGVPVFLDMAFFLRGMEQFMVDMASNNEVGRYIVARLMEQRECVARRCAEAGVDVIGFGDHLAAEEGALISRQMLRQWVLPYYERCVAAARSINPNLIFITHTDGKNGEFIYEDLMSVGITGFNPVECDDPWILKKRFGKKIILWGMTDSRVINSTTPEEVENIVTDRMKLAHAYGGAILGGGSENISYENWVAYHHAIEKYGKG